MSAKLAFHINDVTRGISALKKAIEANELYAIKWITDGDCMRHAPAIEALLKQMSTDIATKLNTEMQPYRSAAAALLASVPTMLQFDTAMPHSILYSGVVKSVKMAIDELATNAPSLLAETAMKLEMPYLDVLDAERRWPSIRDSWNSARDLVTQARR